MAKKRAEPQYVVCLSNARYGASLVVRRLYRVLPDDEASTHGVIRIVDESGEDYLFPTKLFAAVPLPKEVGKKLAKTG